MSLADARETIWKDPSTRETFIIDNRTGNSYPQRARFTAATDDSIESSSKRRTLRTPHPTSETNKNDAGTIDPIPEWLQEALEVTLFTPPHLVLYYVTDTFSKANGAFALKEPKIPALSLSANADTDCCNSQLRQGYHMAGPTKRAIFGWGPTPGSSDFAASQIRFRKDDLRKARIISQVDRKFIACVLGLDPNGPSGEKDNKTCEGQLASDGKTLILIDQHAADERVRVERFLKSICCGFLSHQEGSGGVETKQLTPPVPVLLTRHEASRLADLSDFHKAFESWGFQFSGLEETQSRLECETEVDGGYIQVFVSAIPEIVSEKVRVDEKL